MSDTTSNRNLRKGVVGVMEEAYRAAWMDWAAEPGAMARADEATREVFGAALDALCDYLTKHADEWDGMAYAALENQDDLYDSGYASLLLAVLRDDPA